MPDAAPVTRATSPEKTGGLPPFCSFACSRSQYSTSKMSFAPSARYPPRAVARAVVCMVCE